MVSSAQAQCAPMGDPRPRYLGETITPENGESYDWHTHDFGQLISASSGSMYVGTVTRVLLLSPAMAIWIPPHASHWMRYGSNNEMIYVDVNQTEAFELGSDTRVMAMTPLLNALMLATMPVCDPMRAKKHVDALHDLLRYEIASARDVSLSIAMPRDKRIRALADMALRDPGSLGSVEAWLSAAHASRKTIERLFISETGMPPAQWLRYARLLHAISQLASGKKIGTVAFDLGYDSPSAFSHMFRTTLGSTPSRFLQRTTGRPRSGT